MHIFSSYNELIAFARSEFRTKDNSYYELHHIKPKCTGGTDEKSNLVLLTLGEHVQAHYLLAIEHKDDKKFYDKMLSACIVIIHPKNYIKKDKEAAVKEFLEDDEAIRYYERIRKEYSEYRKTAPSPNKGKHFHFEHRWVQLNNQKPRLVALKSLSRLENEGYEILERCPVCGEKTDDSDWCCSEKCHQLFEQERRIKKSKVQGENTARGWRIFDCTERRKRIGIANKKHANEKAWVNKDGKNKRIKLTELQKYLQLGYARGRIMPNNPVQYRWKATKSVWKSM